MAKMEGWNEVKEEEWGWRGCIMKVGAWGIEEKWGKWGVRGNESRSEWSALEWMSEWGTSQKVRVGEWMRTGEGIWLLVKEARQKTARHDKWMSEFGIKTEHTHTVNNNTVPGSEVPVGDVVGLQVLHPGCYLCGHVHQHSVAERNLRKRRKERETD